MLRWIVWLLPSKPIQVANSLFISYLPKLSNFLNIIINYFNVNYYSHNLHFLLIICEKQLITK
jgi:hypothetical protein